MIRHFEYIADAGQNDQQQINEIDNSYRSANIMKMTLKVNNIVCQRIYRRMH